MNSNTYKDPDQSMTNSLSDSLAGTQLSPFIDTKLTFTVLSIKHGLGRWHDDLMSLAREIYERDSKPGLTRSVDETARYCKVRLLDSITFEIDYAVDEHWNQIVVRLLGAIRSWIPSPKLSDQLPSYVERLFVEKDLYPLITVALVESGDIAQAICSMTTKSKTIRLSTVDCVKADIINRGEIIEIQIYDNTRQFGIWVLKEQVHETELSNELVKIFGILTHHLESMYFGNPYFCTHA